MYIVITIKPSVEIHENDQTSLFKLFPKIEELKRIIFTAHRNPGLGIGIDVWSPNEIKLVIENLNIPPHQQIFHIQLLSHLLSQNNIPGINITKIEITNVQPKKPMQEKDAGPYQAAILKDDIETIKLLISQGNTPNCHDKNKVAPLCLASQLGKIAIVELLLNAGAELSIVDFYTLNTPLHFAIEGLHVEICKLLLEHEANPFASNKAGAFPLGMALNLLRLHEKNTEKLEKIKQIIDLLLEFGAGICFGFKELGPSELMNNKVLLGATGVTNTPSAITTPIQFLERITPGQIRFWDRQLRLIQSWLPNNSANSEIEKILTQFSKTASLKSLVQKKIRECVFNNIELGKPDSLISLGLSSSESKRRCFNFFTPALNTALLPQNLADEILNPLFNSHSLGKKNIIQIIEHSKKQSGEFSEDIKLAIYYLQVALDLSLFLYGEDHIENASIRCKLAELYCKDEDFSEAIYLFSQAEQNYLSLANQNLELVDKAMELNQKKKGLAQQHEMLSPKKSYEESVDQAYKALRSGNILNYNALLQNFEQSPLRIYLMQRMQNRGIRMGTQEENRKTIIQQLNPGNFQLRK